MVVENVKTFSHHRAIKHIRTYMLNKCKEKDTHQEFFFIDESDTIGLSGLQICLLFRFIDYMFNVIANMKVQ